MSVGVGSNGAEQDKGINAGLFGSDVALFADMDDESATDDDYWTVNCSKDRITDEKICLMGKYEMMFIRSSKTGWMFSVSKELKRKRPLNTPYEFIL